MGVNRCLVGLLDFKSSVGLLTVPVGFDSHSLPPFDALASARLLMAGQKRASNGPELVEGPVLQ